MNDEVPWIYVVMIFIAFVSWVSSRIKEAKEARRAKMIEKRAAQEARNSTRTAKQPPPSPYRPAERPVAARPVAAPAPVSEPEPEPEVPKTFRELFEMLQEQAAPGTDSPPPASKPAVPPPPLPSEAVADTRSAEDRLFYGTPKPKAVKPAPPIRVERVKGKTSSNLKEILKTRGTLREALILKEILDTPVSMRE